MSLPEHTKRYTVRAKSAREAMGSIGQLRDKVGDLWIWGLAAHPKQPPTAWDTLLRREMLWDVEVRFTDVDPTPKFGFHYCDANGDPLVS